LLIEPLLLSEVCKELAPIKKVNQEIQFAISLEGIM
jgi:hypothetical protein